jgi:hypothetical protein
MMSGKKKSSNIFDRIFLIVIILGIGVFFGLDFVKYMRINLDPVLVAGKVKSKQTKSTVTEAVWTDIVVEFTNHTGSKHQFKVSYGIPILHFFISPDVGERVSVKYSKSHPKIAMLDSLWRSFLLPFSVILLCIFGIYYILKYEHLPT